MHSNRKYTSSTFRKIRNPEQKNWYGVQLQLVESIQWINKWRLPRIRLLM